jgi:catechol 2,3-dioxygenase-like lactoylglutathione lyase family enzyme
MPLTSRLIRTSLILAVLMFLPAVEVRAGESCSASVTAVNSAGFTVSDIERSVAFYNDVLAFTLISDVEVDGPEYDQLWGVFGVRARVVRMQLGSQLFLGIDHTAMTVRSTENSPKFYHDLLGLTVAGGTLNMGAEQQHLDSLPGARVRVTGLTPTKGLPGIEFLEYELPTAGRPFPIDSHPTDLWHWQTTLVAADVEAALATLRGTAQFVSSTVITLPDKALGFTKGFQVRDPDGHTMQIVSP